MAWSKTDLIPQSEIKDKVTEVTVKFAERFGNYLGTNDCKTIIDKKTGKEKEITESAKLTTTQLRKFFGEVKRQQMQGYNETEFILLKPKLAYAVGRVGDRKAKINDFYYVISDAMSHVKDNDSFHRFIQVFEAIVAYHKAAEV